MAFQHIQLGASSTHGPLLRNALSQFETGYRNLIGLLATKATMISNADASQAANYPEMTARFGYQSDAQSKEAYEELLSLISKLTTDNSVVEVRSAIEQALTKFTIGKDQPKKSNLIMNGFLRADTNGQSRALGPFISDTDFITPETGLTIANTDIKLVGDGGSSSNKNSGGGTHRVNGIYGITFDAIDTNVTGELSVSVLVSGAMIVFATYTVLEEAAYDALFAPGALGYVDGATVDVTKIGGDAQSATDLKDFADAGYDPSTNKVQGVVLVDAVTALSTGAIAAASFAAGAIDNAAIATDAIGAAELSQAACQEIADEVLNRNIAGGGSGNTRNVRNALRGLRNRVDTASGALVVYAEDDTTPAWGGTVTRDTVDPITEINPT